ncbi:MAG: helix-turn-helix transcriptional regulator [Bacteroidia bacterium]
MKKKYPSQLKQFGNRIKDLRLESGLTQAQFAKQSGISIRTIQRTEAGEFAASLNIVFALADAFRIRPDELLLNIDLAKSAIIKTKKNSL